MNAAKVVVTTCVASEACAPQDITLKTGRTMHGSAHVHALLLLPYTHLGLY